MSNFQNHEKRVKIGYAVENRVTTHLNYSGRKQQTSARRGFISKRFLTANFVKHSVDKKVFSLRFANVFSTADVKPYLSCQNILLIVYKMLKIIGLEGSKVYLAGLETCESRVRSVILLKAKNLIPLKIISIYK